MTSTAFFLILASVILHASWHFISKSQRPPMAFFLLVSFAGMMTAMPFALCSGLHVTSIPWYGWLLPLAGGLCGVVTNAGFSFAYRLTDVSLAYPLARALPVLMTAAVTSVLGIGSSLSWLGAIGMVVIFIGCMMMPLKHLSGLHPKNYMRNRALIWIVIAAIGTTGYTIIDKIGIDVFLRYGVPQSGFSGSCAYAAIREFCLLCFLFLTVRLIPHERAHLTKELLHNKLGYLSGIFATSAYVLVLLAMHFVTNVSYVQAFRQMSLPVGVFLGIFFLKEKVTLPKLLGLCFIMIGLIAVSMK